MTRPDVWSPVEDLSEAQCESLRAYEQQLIRLNQKINLVSPNTESEVATTHIRHSLMVRYRSFPSGSVVVDWGAGGGLPSIPLAICCPHITVHAIDSVGKKVRAMRTIVRRLGLDNCFPWHGRAGRWPGTAHYSVSRATAPLQDLWRWHDRVAMRDGITVQSEDWIPGLICLKGGDLSDEMRALFERFPKVWVDQFQLNALCGSDVFGPDKQLVGVFSQTHA